jgi:MFS family permease
MKRLFLLALGAFAIGTEGYAIAGLLPKVAADVGVTVPVAGQLITAFSLSFALGSPLLAVATGHLERKRLLLGSILVFGLFNVVAASAHTYAMLLMARIGLALSAAAFMPAASAYAVAVSPVAQRGRALSIILIVPMGLLAAMTGVWLSRGDNNMFTQIGLMVLVGLSAKNAILIVEFARELEFAGRSPVQAAIEASRLRLRPILMTSLAFVMGVLPLVLSTGAGAEMRQAMGVAVFAGMIGVTAFGLFLTPVFYVVLRRLAGNRPLRQHGPSTHEVPVPAFAGGATARELPAAPRLHD